MDAATASIHRTHNIIGCFALSHSMSALHYHWFTNVQGAAWGHVPILFRHRWQGKRRKTFWMSSLRKPLAKFAFRVKFRTKRRQTNCTVVIVVVAADFVAVKVLSTTSTGVFSAYSGAHPESQPCPSLPVTAKSLVKGCLNHGSAASWRLPCALPACYYFWGLLRYCQIPRACTDVTSITNIFCSI